jgi:hypothetical protein
MRHRGLGLVLAAVMAGCGGSPSLSDAAWVWCQNQENSNAVDDAAETLGLMRTYKLPEDDAARYTNLDYQKACQFIYDRRTQEGFETVAPMKPGDADEYLRYCGSVWALTFEFTWATLGLPVEPAGSDDLGRPSWWWRGLAGEALRDDPDYGRACTAAYESR